MKHKYLFTFLILLMTCQLHADEGMWLLGKVDKRQRNTMKDLGLKVPFREVYSPNHISLKDAVVSFGGFCSGVVISNQGLVLTNHHCGLRSVQQHSSAEVDLLKYGYTALTKADELSSPDLYVRFLIETKDVTKRVLRAVKEGMTEGERTLMINAVMLEIEAEVSKKDSTLTGVVDAYYGGNEFWLSTYRDYTDIRLVFAPSSSVGKFGWDTDNWMWPRHTGDFCVFRIYADKNNLPADYSPDNIPFTPPYVAPISLAGYKEGSFSMTMGYPGATERYLTSFGIEEMMNGSNQAMIDMRGIKQTIWKKWMNESDSIRIKYASAYDESSNYWKNSIGMNKAIKQLGIIDKKKQLEKSLMRWIQDTPSERKQLMHLLSSLELNYKSRKISNHDLAYFVESFFNGSDLIKLALMIMNLDFEGEEKVIYRTLDEIVSSYDKFDATIDKEVLTKMLEVYPQYVSESSIPAVYDTIKNMYNNDVRQYVDSLYANSELTSIKGLQRILTQDTTFNLFEDPAALLTFDMLSTYFALNGDMQEASDNIQRDERLFNAAVRRMYDNKSYYPDANSTLRLSFGTVQGYTPYDGAYYNYYTTPKGIFQKAYEHWGNPDFEISPTLVDLLARREYGRYADESGDLRVCFISNNDISGGNSGSAMFNGKAELMGLAFDGNWEAMSSDVAFEPNMQRCIGVDIRYILFIIEKYGRSAHIINELDIR